MSGDCLLLNGNGKPVSYFPLSVVDWKTALKLIITRNVVVIKDHANWLVRSPSITFRVPSIIMLQRYHRFSNYVKFSRSNVFLRDIFQCQYCANTYSRKELTLDHVIPKSKGGHSNWENVVTACKSCNIAKGNRDIHPIRDPEKPTYRQLLNGYPTLKEEFKDKEWVKYIAA